MGILEDRKSFGPTNEDSLKLAREFYKEHLKSLELLPSQIETQNLEQLGESLNRVDEALKNIGSYGTLKINVKSPSSGILPQASTESTYEISILNLLLESKKLVLNRIKSLSATQGEKEEADKKLKEVEQRQIDEKFRIEYERKKQDTELLERRSAVYLSFIEKESIATIVGAILLIIIAFAELAAMFLNISTSEVVNNAFLLILGYFFGQTVSRFKNQ